MDGALLGKTWLGTSKDGDWLGIYWLDLWELSHRAGMAAESEVHRAKAEVRRQIAGVREFREEQVPVLDLDFFLGT